MKSPENLFKKYQEGNCTEAERSLIEWYITQPKSPSLSDDELLTLSREIKSAFPNLGGKATKICSWPLRIVITTAAIVVLVGIWTLLFVKTPVSANYGDDVDPGSNKATLTLPGGQILNLSSTKTGVVIGVNHLKYDDGSAVERGDPGLRRDDGSTVLSSRAIPLSFRANAKNLTITTPLGGTYQITLPDGSKVWLNAGSTLKFPATFAGSNKRTVTLTGEAYFEIAKQRSSSIPGKQPKRVPFIVTTQTQQVEVLGTHFNINSYADESVVRTTLLEGSVKVATLQPLAPTLSSRGKRSDEGSLNNALTLKPNQQSLHAGNALIIKQVDPAIAIAWKNGEFAFRNEPLESIMRKIARWYNVTIHYENNNARNIPFGGSISRFGKVSEVLCMLELTGKVKFKIEGRQITVK